MQNIQIARNLYAKGCTIVEIAREIGVSERTVQNYKKTDKDTPSNWDTARERYNLSPLAIKDQYANQVKALIQKADSDPEFAASPAYADAIRKHLKNLKDLNPGALAYGLFIDFVKIVNGVIQTHAPELFQTMKKLWPLIKEQLKRFLNKKSVL